MLDIGCGTGSLLCKFAHSGRELELIGVDPAQASLDVARSKQGADSVQWYCADMSALPELTIDLALMTGNVAQIFVDLEHWKSTLSRVQSRLKCSGYFIFEVRDPAQQGWLEWTKFRTLTTIEVPHIGTVESWVELTHVSQPLVSFEWTYKFKQNGAVLTSESTLCFREKDEIESSLIESGFKLIEVRGAIDRPAKELIFVSTVDAL